MKTSLLFRAGLLVSLVSAALTFISCNAPTTMTLPGKSSVSVSVGGPHGRSVMADLTALQDSVTSYEVKLTSNEGFAPLTQTLTVPLSGPALFPSVTTGTWNVTVTAFAGATAVGLGTLSDQVVEQYTPATWDVVVAATQWNTGDFALTLTYPHSVGVTSMTARLADFTYDQVVATTAVDSTNGTTDTQVISNDAPIQSGRYTLTLTWYRGATVVASRLESVNICDNQISNKWASGSSLLPQLELTAADFASGDSSLASLVLRDANAGDPTAAVATTVTFTPSTLDYELVPTIGIVRFDVTFGPGQNIEFSYWDNQTWYSVLGNPNGFGNHGLGDSAKWVKFRVTAADGTQTIYTVTGPSGG